MNKFINLATEEGESSPMFYELIWQYILEFYGLLKYIFHDVFLGKDPW